MHISLVLFVQMHKLFTVDQETFSIIQSICRVGLGQGNQAFRHQVERLRETLVQQGAKTEAKAVDRLLRAEARTVTMAPSRVTVSQAFVGAETLSIKTVPPTDRETGAALADIIFPTAEEFNFPIMDARLQDAIQSIAEEWQNHDKLLRAGVVPPTTCLFYGLPGTGKTRVALAMAAQLGLPVILSRLDGVISSFLGTTGRNVANLFEFANRYNCLLLLDEFDAIAKVRDDPHEVGEIKRVVNTILQNIDSRKTRGLTVAVTNHEQLLDSAVWRRFEVRISFPTPGMKEREKIALHYFGSPELDETKAHFVAWLSEGMTGADIEVMAKNVKRFRALRPDSNFIAALKHYSLTQAGRSNLRHQAMLNYSLPQLAREMDSSPELSFTQTQIANTIGVSQPQVGRWIKERTHTHENDK